MNEHTLMCDGVSFGKIIDSISFSIPPHETLAVVGHNGAGKTTLFHLLLGLKFKTSGIFKISEKKIGYVPERPYLPMEDCFGSFLQLHLNLISFPKSQQADEVKRVSSLVGLEKKLDQNFQTFSKGMLQKALLAQALLGNPNLIFLDEPMSGLDPESREDLKKSLMGLKKLGVTLVFTSHVMEDVHALADHVLELDSGKQKFFGSVQNWRKK